MKIFNTHSSFERVFLIAEAGSNHNGSLDTAVEMVHQASRTGADAVKFQDYTIDSLFADRYYTQILNLKGEAWKKQIAYSSFKPEWREVIAREAQRCGIFYFTTPFSPEIVDEIDPFVPFFKIASCDITFYPLLEKVASKKKGVFLSTGASSIEEIEQAVRILSEKKLPFVCILHCVMLYPPPFATLHLNFIQTLTDRFGLPVGFSDHSPGIDAALCAVARGARVIEKHFTLDKGQKGGDHTHSLDIKELTTLVKKIRLYEEMLGNNQKIITEREGKERVYARRGIYAARSLKKGERLDFDGLHFLRPNIAVGVEHVGEVIGRTLARDIPRGDPIDFSMLE